MIADFGNGRIWRLHNEEVTLLSGTDTGEIINGTAKQSSFASPRYIHRQRDGCYLIVDSGAHMIRRLAPPSTIQSACHAFEKAVAPLEAKVAKTDSATQSLEKEFQEALVSLELAHVSILEAVLATRRSVYQKLLQQLADGWHGEVSQSEFSSSRFVKFLSFSWCGLCFACFFVFSHFSSV